MDPSEAVPDEDEIAQVFSLDIDHAAYVSLEIDLGRREFSPFAEPRGRDRRNLVPVQSEPRHLVPGRAA